jgi:hypothetical protein
VISNADMDEGLDVLEAGIERTANKNSAVAQPV